MSAYKRLLAILETTGERQQPLSAEIRGKPGQFVLAVVERRGSKRRTLATAPFEPGEEDDAALDVARQLTLDGKLPRGMDR